MKTLPITIGIGAVVLLGAGYLRYAPDWSFEHIRTRGQATADSLTAYAGAHGKCPAGLAELGLAAPSAQYGAFTYRTYRNGSTCELSTGDYFKDGEVIWWQWPPGEWYINR